MDRYSHENDSRKKFMVVGASQGQAKEVAGKSSTASIEVDKALADMAKDMKEHKGRLNLICYHFILC